MFDYIEAMRQVSIIQSQADFMRSQSHETASLASIVGGSYQGEDATLFQSVVDSTYADLLALAKDLDQLATAIESAAKKAQQKEDALEGENSEFTYYKR